jgi:XTP/dITP diphosphohydrolase
MELWLATGNKGKVEEIKNLLSDFPFEIHTQDEMSFFSQPPEDGDSFEANARIKAKALHAMKPESWTLADDSGLVVDGLGGLPGIHSARYAGPQARASENNAKLLKMMQLRAMDNRKAHFHCSLVAIDPNGKEHIFDGKLEGEIAKAARGQGGFGYDPVFIPQGETRTVAEMTAGEKNAISHRSKALKAFVEVLKTMV